MCVRLEGKSHETTIQNSKRSRRNLRKCRGGGGGASQAPTPCTVRVKCSWNLFLLGTHLPHLGGEWQMWVAILQKDICTGAGIVFPMIWLDNFKFLMIWLVVAQCDGWNEIEISLCMGCHRSRAAVYLVITDVLCWLANFKFWMIWLANFKFLMIWLVVSQCDGWDEVVACAWDGQTYIIDHTQQSIRFHLKENVCAFTAGKIHIWLSDICSGTSVFFRQKDMIALGLGLQLGFTCRLGVAKGCRCIHACTIALLCLLYVYYAFSMFHFQYVTFLIYNVCIW